MTNKPKQHATRLCACGCGHHPVRWDAQYVAGHRPPSPLAEHGVGRTYIINIVHGHERKDVA